MEASEAALKNLLVADINLADPMTVGPKIRDILESVPITHIFDCAGDILSPGKIKIDRIVKEIISYVQETRRDIRYVYLSSGQVYGKGPNWNKESDAKNPCSQYALCKSCDEELLMCRYNMLEHQIKGGDGRFVPVVVRLFNVIGPRQKIGFVVPDIINNFMFYRGKDNCYLEAIKEIVIDLQENSMRMFLDVRDACRAIMAVSNSDSWINNIWNVAGYPFWGLEILNLIIRIQNVVNPEEISINVLNTEENLGASVLGKCAFLYGVTDWQPKISITQSIKDTWKWWEWVMEDIERREIYCG
jgi:nucleoside-diphosphate-sugar epimerase